MKKLQLNKSPIAAAIALVLTTQSGMVLAQEQAKETAADKN